MSEPGPTFFDRLPLELVYSILRFAARDGVAQQTLAWATTLPLVSRAVRAQVVPILYHTVVVGQKMDRYRSLMRNPSSRAMLSHVQQLYVYRWLDNHDVQLFARALTSTNMRIIHAPMNLIKQLSASGDLSATEIHIEFAPFETITTIGAPALSVLTHLQAFWPDDSDLEGSPNFERALSLPALTHLAIRFAEFDQRRLPSNFDFSAMSLCLRAVLKHPTLRCLVLELAGAYMHSESDFRGRLQELRDDRVFLWVDDRISPQSWYRFREISEADALLGPSIWHRGHAVYPPEKKCEHHGPPSRT